MLENIHFAIWAYRITLFPLHRYDWGKWEINVCVALRKRGGGATDRQSYKHLRNRDFQQCCYFCHAKYNLYEAPLPFIYIFWPGESGCSPSLGMNAPPFLCVQCFLKSHSMSANSRVAAAEKSAQSSNEWVFESSCSEYVPRTQSDCTEKCWSNTRMVMWNPNSTRSDMESSATMPGGRQGNWMDNGSCFS